MKRSRKLIAVRAAQLTPVITAISPHVQIIVVADNTSAALELYEQDADFVYITRLHSARHRAGLIAGAVQDEDDIEGYREKELEELKRREEVLL